MKRLEAIAALLRELYRLETLLIEAGADTTHPEIMEQLDDLMIDMHSALDPS